MSISEKAVIKAVAHFIEDARYWAQVGRPNQVESSLIALRGISMVAAFAGVSVRLDETITKAREEIRQLQTDARNAEITRLEEGAVS